MNKLPKFITFDAYGTLINFQMSKTVLGILGERAKRINTEAFLDEFHEARWQDLHGEYRPYEAHLRRAFANIMMKYNLDYRIEDSDALMAAIPTWGPFPDVPPVLRKLRQYCKIVIISNAEDRIMEKNIENIGVPFDDYITAEQARAYKPAHVVFEYTLKKLGCDKSEVLHVANGFIYDIIPAYELGWEKVWIDRGEVFTGDKTKYGSFVTMPDMTGLPALLGIE